MTGRLRAVLGSALVAGSLYGAFAGPAGTAGATGTPASPSCTTLGGTATCTFLYTGAEQPFVVPATASSVTGTAVGAQGQSTTTTSNPTAPRASGGEGAEASGTLDVTAGHTVYVEVGGTGATGGWNGGGHGGTDPYTAAITPGGHGGGASDVRTRSIAATATAGSTAQTLGSRILVAGGGGGGGWHGYTDDTTTIDGGAGGNGGAAGTSGGDASTATCSTAGGGGGTPGQTNAGTGGGGTPAAETPGNPGTTGSAGSGGAGGSYTYTGGGSGGGGGGGYVGGGGGGAGGTTYVATVCDALSGSGGGGGGSSYTTATGQIAGTPVETPAEVTITWTGVLPAPRAADLDYTVAEGKVLHVATGAGLLSNGTSYGATLTLATAPAHGTITPFDNGAFTYTPTAAFAGTDTFRYEETNTAGSSTGTVTLDVVPTTLYVRHGSGGTTCSTSTSGSSSGDACGSISTAVARAHTMTGSILVTVGPGTYAGGIAITSTPTYSSLTIEGETGAAQTTVTGGGSERDVTITTSTDEADAPVRTVTLSGLTIAGGKSGTSGGAVVTVDGADTFADDVVSTDVSSDNSGGAVWNDAGADTFTGDTFSNDHSRYNGGAVRTYFGTSGFTDDTFSTDVATTGAGGAVYGGYGADTFTGDTFSHNAAVDGGAVGISAEGTTTPTGPERGTASATFTDDTFSNNEAETGGAVMSTGILGTETAVFTDDTFATDHATGAGGAVSSVGTDGTARASFTDDTFAGDHAPAGGAVSNSEDSSTYPTSSASASFVDDTFRDDLATLAVTTGAFGNSGSASLDASILDGSTCPDGTGGSLSGAYDVATTAACVIGTTSVQATTLHLATTLGTTSSYPTAPATLALEFTSPAIDEVPCTLTGLPSTDERGAPRPASTAGRTCDAGAYQFAPVAATPGVTIGPSPVTLTAGAEPSVTFTVSVTGAPGHGYPEGTIAALGVTGTAEPFSCTESATHPATATTDFDCHFTSTTALSIGTHAAGTASFEPATLSSSKRGYTYSPATSAQVTFSVILATPTGVSAQTTTDQVTVAWSSVAHATSYEVFDSRTEPVPTTGAPACTTTTTTCTVRSLSGGTRYWFVVVATDTTAGVSSSPSSAVTAVPETAAPALATPAGVSARGSTRQATVTWTSVADATAYEVFDSTTEPVPTTGTPACTTTGTSCTVRSLSGGTRYWFVVVATDTTAGVSSSPSSAVTAAPKQPTAVTSGLGTGPGAPATPTGVTAQATTGQVAVHWSSVTPATSYEVFDSRTEPVPTTGAPACTTTGTSCDVSSLTDGTTYWFVVVATNATGSSSPSPAVTATPETAAIQAPQTGYDLVGADGGVFVFNPPGVAGGFYGSLPGIHVAPKKPIVGMVATINDRGYFLVGADGGVFSFGNAPFLGSLPGLGVVPACPITGIVAANADKGYFLVGCDGGVFAFGTVPFLGSLPGSGIHVSNIVAIASTPGGTGYWLVSSTGTVYAFGKAKDLGTAKGTSSPVSAIAGTPTGGGYWITTRSGAVHAFGTATSYGTLPAIDVTSSLGVIGIVVAPGTTGYWLVGADGGIFAFGSARFDGSLPDIRVHVRDIVGAVPN